MNKLKFFYVTSFVMLTSPVFGVGFEGYNCNIFVKQVESTSDNGDCFNESKGCGLQQALNIAMNNGIDDVICIKAGTYSITERLKYIGRSSENKSVKLVGETDSQGNILTILDGGGTSQILGVNLCLWNGQNCSLSLPNVSFHIENIKIENGNYVYDGGGVRIYSNDSNIYLKNMILSNNTTQRYGGGLLIWTPQGNISLDSIKFENNNAIYYGGGAVLWARDGNISVKKTSFESNTGRIGGGLFAFSINGTVSIEESEFSSNNSSSRSGGLEAYSENNTVLVKSSIFKNNTALGYGGGSSTWSKSGNITIENSYFKENNSQSHGGGLFIWTETGDVSLNANSFYKNVSRYSGGGLYLYTYSNGVSVLTNNIFSQDSATEYDGGNTFIYSKTGEVYVINNTFYGGKSANTAGRLLLWLPNSTSKGFIYNNIFWQGDSPQNLDIGVIKSSNTLIKIFNNLLSCSVPYGSGTCLALTNLSNYEYGNNITGNPLFSQEPEDLHILEGSPAIDAGNNSAPHLPDKDKDGNPRISGNSVDIGAYEYMYGETGGGEETPTYSGNIFVFPKRYLFGYVQIGQNRSGKILVANTGNDVLHIEGVSLTGDQDFSIVNDECSSSEFLSQGQTCVITVLFSPQDTGLRKAIVNIKSSDNDSPNVNVELQGIGLSFNVPNINVSDYQIDFGTIPVGGESEKIIHITNNGMNILKIFSIVLRGKDTQDFHITDNCTGKDISPGENCSVSVIFKPISQGEKLGELVVYSNDPDDFEVKIGLTGTGL